jgi:broad specificity phosphatase PhoE
MSLRNKGIDRIYASPYLRTIQTANQIAAVLDLPIHLEPGLGEILPNVSETPLLLSKAELVALFERIDDQHSALYQPTFPEVEALAHRRAGETVQKLADQYAGENLLIVTHAAPVVGIIRHLTGIQEKIRVPLCSLFTLARSDNGWELMSSADISHLSQQDVAERHAHIG